MTTALKATPEAVPPDDVLLLDVGAISRLLSISRATVWRMRDAGRIPQPVRLGGAVRWRAKDIREWVSAGCPLRPLVKGAK